MVIVTLLSLSLSLQQDVAVLSIVGTLGALGTPFMLYGGEGGVVLLICYTALVLAGSTVVYMKKGWKTLLWSIGLGGALVMFVGIATTTYDSEPASLFEHWVLQAGVFLWMGCAWLLPVYREVLTKKDPSRWPSPGMLTDDGTLDEYLQYRTSTNIHLMLFVVPLFMLVMTVALWELSMDEAGYVGMSLAALSSLLPAVKKKRSGYAGFDKWFSWTKPVDYWICSYPGRKLSFYCLDYRGRGIAVYIIQNRGCQDWRKCAPSFWDCLLLGRKYTLLQPGDYHRVVGYRVDHAVERYCGRWSADTPLVFKK
ncbi:MAG: DUF2339 domain-containing protein [Fodinibius sp.]|nr:DUF2339 domain-containing protein [Fodinibius sp.]